MAALNRRWLRFNLRTMFVLVTAFAVWLGWEVHIVRMRRAAIVELRHASFAQVLTAAETNNPNGATVSRLRELLGDEAVEMIRYPSGRPASANNRLKWLFPEADVGQL